ncbi:MAG: hypothetical protein DMG60_19565 [Acidobacteria bacterium]|nr:MAG: hypothetical protein DMG60_19565 [Acidobacteriota bacterium]
MPRRNPLRGSERSVFLNIPYDAGFQKLYLAYIAGISAFGLVPRATLEIPTSERRLDRIIDLIDECAYSIHDLSRVQLDRRAPRTPRFNMPFELGLAVARNKSRGRQRWYVCESLRRRVNKSLSDLDGTEVHIHEGRLLGLFAVLGDIFVRRRRQPSVQQMYAIYRAVSGNLPTMLRAAGTRDPYRSRVFRDLVLAARTEQLKLIR